MTRKTPYCKDSNEPVSIQGVYEVAVHGKLTGAGEVITTHHYFIPNLELNPVAWRSWVQAWWSVVAGKYLDLLTNQYTLTGLSMRDMLSPSLHRVPLPIVEGGSGTLSGPSADYQTACQITYQTFNTRRGGASGFRIGPPSASALDEGRITDAHLNALSVLAEALQSYHVGDPPCQLVVPDACHGTYYPADGYSINYVPASQDTRRPQRGS
jgi:hypothetical protein